MDASGVIQLVFLAVLILLSAFFSSAETALSTVNRVRIRTLAEEGNKRAIKVNQVLEKYSKMLSTILIGNNIVNQTDYVMKLSGSIDSLKESSKKLEEHFNE